MAAVKIALIKNLRLISQDVSEDVLSKMEHAALEHQRHSSITFKIVEYDVNKIVIQAVQGKNATGIYHSQKRLIEIVHETFDRFFKKIQVHAIPFKESLAQKNVTPAWINKQMLDKGTSLKQLSEDTGIDKTQLSSLITGDRTLSAPMKAMFWYYFLSK